MKFKIGDRVFKCDKFGEPEKFGTYIGNTDYSDMLWVQWDNSYSSHATIEYWQEHLTIILQDWDK